LSFSSFLPFSGAFLSENHTCNPFKPCLEAFKPRLKALETYGGKSGGLGTVLDVQQRAEILGSSYFLMIRTQNQKGTGENVG
jgi:hypothetical protein